MENILLQKFDHNIYQNIYIRIFNIKHDLNIEINNEKYIKLIVSNNLKIPTDLNNFNITNDFNNFNITNDLNNFNITNDTIGQNIESFYVNYSNEEKCYITLDKQFKFRLSKCANTYYIKENYKNIYNDWLDSNWLDGDESNIFNLQNTTSQSMVINNDIDNDITIPYTINLKQNNHDYEY